MGIFRSIHSIASDIKSIRDVMEVQSKTLITTPKSICAMTSLLEPRIAKDFPEFSWREFCPNCGAPVTILGQKKCEYCGSALTVINRHVWTLSRIYES